MRIKTRVQESALHNNELSVGFDRNNRGKEAYMDSTRMSVHVCVYNLNDKKLEKLAKSMNLN